MALVLSALSTQQEYFWPLSSAGTIFQPTVTVYISRGCCFHAFIPAWVRFCATSWTLLWHIVICCLFRLIQSNWHLGVLLSCIWCAESYPSEKDPARCSLQTTEKLGGILVTALRSVSLFSGVHVIVFAKHLIWATWTLLLDLQRFII